MMISQITEMVHSFVRSIYCLDLLLYSRQLRQHLTVETRVFLEYHWSGFLTTRRLLLLLQFVKLHNQLTSQNVT